MALDKNRVTQAISKLKKALKKGTKWRAPSDVHQLRTRIRRVQSELEIAKPYIKIRTGWLLRKLTRVHKKAGKVRDSDVMMGHLTGLQTDGEQDCLIQLQQQLGFERYRKERQLRRTLRKNRSAVTRELAKSSRRLKKSIEKGSEEQTAAAASVLKFSTKLGAPITLNRNNLHEYRSTIKDLRNVLELGDDSAHEKFLDALKEAKDAIGEWHDWEELFSLANDSLHHSPGCKLLNQLKDTADNKFQSALALTNKLRKTYFDAKRKGRAPRRGQVTAPTPLKAASRLLA
jgi:CHAD domain-containing protein